MRDSANLVVKSTVVIHARWHCVRGLCDDGVDEADGRDDPLFRYDDGGSNCELCESIPVS